MGTSGNIRAVGVHLLLLETPTPSWNLKASSAVRKERGVRYDRNTSDLFEEKMEASTFRRSSVRFIMSDMFEDNRDVREKST